MIYTIGHSSHEPDALLTLLRRHGVTAVADVRSQPYSRRFPHYSRKALKGWLQEQGIAYVFLGRELGGRSADPDHYDETGRVDYGKLAASEPFRSGIDRLRQGMAAYRIALLCAERDPLDCHRGLLIAPRLQEAGVEVGHILADGGLEPHRQTEERLLSLLGLADDLFGEPRAQRLMLAYRRRAEEAAYRKPTGGRP
ncbi:hypothetical protein MIN45_P1318 [Methylomarinovum tepidoasis]|uniref:DUF488 domain-containing protein n=1 Tax=Methylomarinovum tepidoasis TaxID=2840183 RepID=A0AAU9BZD5_9GAMM|nr:DUF488 domain-containing protein [Methylomarinovum sp. IN45]BCX88948.1 hypothetical protein MIN45_P1318 [Methylomarinovum sp. IN45]